MLLIDQIEGFSDKLHICFKNRGSIASELFFVIYNFSYEDFFHEIEDNVLL